MALTSEQIEMIAVDVTTGKEPRVTGPEADKFRKELAADLALAKKRGWTVELPFEVLRDD